MSTTSPSKRPRVSVVMALYNRETEVAEAIDSVLAQTYEDFELIVVDDCSTDKSGEVVRRYGDRVRYIRRNSNGGVGASRNTGIEAARGELLCYCDADDVQLPFRIAAQVAAIDKNPDAAMVFTDFKTYVRGKVTSDSHLRARWLGPSIRSFETEIKDAFSAVTTCRALELPMPPDLLDRNVYSGRVPGLIALMHVAWGCAQLMRIDRVRAVGGHWEKARAYEDWCLTSDLSKRWELVFLDAPALLYRVHPEQLTGRPRLNIECYRDVILHTWRGDHAAYLRHKEIVDLSLGTAYALLGELEAQEGRWREAEEAFRRAVLAWPKLKRAYPNLALAALRSRVPLFAESPISRMLPPFVQGR